MITHRYPLTEAAEAFRVADEGKSGKVMFVWN
jgi:threonine dehydrogenase-like Zn-dependent dehydrogenase